VTRLPDELAPKLRAAAEKLLNEVGEREWDGQIDRSARDTQKCWKCGGAEGSLTFHHLPNGSTVMVHKRCHRKIHGQAGGKSRKRKRK
jgi:hypothetical protein